MSLKPPKPPKPKFPKSRQSGGPKTPRTHPPLSVDKLGKQYDKMRGRFSLEEENFIYENHSILSLDDIAKKLNRHPRAIRDFILRNDLSKPEDYRLRHKLYTRTYWKEIRSQLLENEVEKFVVTWIKMMEQFAEDFQHSEELQLKQFILCEILIDRAIRSQTEALKKINEAEKIIAVEQTKNPPTMDIINFQLSFIAQYNAVAQQAGKERLELAKESQKLFDALKASRNQRVTKISDANKTFSSALQILEDPEMRELVGKDISLLHTAQLRATHKLYEYFGYQDGKIDNPILNYETFDYLDKTGKLEDAENPSPNLPDPEEFPDPDEIKKQESVRDMAGRDPNQYREFRNRYKGKRIRTDI